MVLVDGGYYDPASDKCYFYLTDHLGNNRVVADASGNVIQATHYYPYGMSFAESTNPTKQPFKYNAKELDMENGLNWYDYVARQMDSTLGGVGFMSIDPLCEKYCSVSPYTYCNNNPVNYVDPDGRDIVIWYRNENDKQVSFTFNGQNGTAAPNNNFVNFVISAYNYNVKNGGGNNLKIIATSDVFNIGVVETSNDNKYQGGFIRFNPTAGLQLNDGNIISPATSLEHEAAHAVNDKTGKKDSTRDSQYNTKEERSVIIGPELETAKANGELPEHHRGRSSHAEGSWVVTKSVISNQELDKRSSEALRIRIKKFYNSWTSE